MDEIYTNKKNRIFKQLKTKPVQDFQIINIDYCQISTTGKSDQNK